METVAVVSEKCSLRCFIHGKGSRMQVAVLDDQLPRDGLAPEEFVDGNDFAGHLCVLVAAKGDGHCSVQHSQCQVKSVCRLLFVIMLRLAAVATRPPPRTGCASLECDLGVH